MKRTGAGAALYAVRAGAGMSLREVAAAVGVSPSYLCRVERGRATPTDEWVRRVAVTLGEHLAHVRGLAA